MSLQPWIVRKIGADTNGGTSKTVRSTVSDGVTAGTNTLTSATAAWSAGDIGHGIVIAGTHRLVTAVASAGSLTFSGATISAGSGKTVVIGGPFLTVGAAVTQAIAGDTTWIGAGVYRETLTQTVSGSAGNVITYNGDYDGVMTGDAGDVDVSNWLTNDTTAPTATAPLTITSRSYLAYSHMNFLNGGTNNCLIGSTTVDHITFTDCQLWSPRCTGNNVSLTLKVDANSAVTFKRCVLMTGTAQQFQITIPTSTTADYDSGWLISDCVLIGGNSISITIGGGNTFHGGGGTLTQNTVICMTSVINVTNDIHLSTLYPVKAYGNFSTVMTGVSYVAGGSNFALIEDWNIADVGTIRTAGDVGIGPNTPSIAYNCMPEMLGWLLTGRGPRPMLQPRVASPVLGLMPVGTQIAVGIPTTAADDATVGTISWTNPNNALVFDNGWATCVLTAGTTGHYLILTGFGFTLPSTATVTQVRVEIIGKQTVSNNVLNNSIKLVKGGVISGNDNVALMVALSTSGGNAVGSVGAAADLWGLTLLYSDINASNFGVAISYKDTSGSAATANVDYVRIIVNYIDSAVTPADQLTDFTQAARPAGGQIKIAAGALERGNTSTQEVSTVHTGSNAIKIAGPGYQDFQLAVNAASANVTAYMRYDGSYAGSALPTMQVLNGTECGVANASTAQVGGANAWEQVTLTIVPTSKGVVTVRFSNLSTAAAGNVFVDTLGVA